MCSYLCSYLRSCWLLVALLALPCSFAMGDAPTAGAGGDGELPGLLLELGRLLRGAAELRMAAEEWSNSTRP
jgi:hypothetical protein